MPSVIALHLITYLDTYYFMCAEKRPDNVKACPPSILSIGKVTHHRPIQSNGQSAWGCSAETPAGFIFCHSLAYQRRRLPSNRRIEEPCRDASSVPRCVPQALLCSVVWLPPNNPPKNGKSPLDQPVDSVESWGFP